ncbi:response regulator [Kineococcus sp. SYSU DK003]|uniref:response regulator n=1 Tax=Kineococcus sp. SYSU DK003 TaxID=3383124 RepID=UPI003D7D24A9
MSVRVLVADDQTLVRAGLVALLRAAPGTEVAGEAADGQQAVELTAAVRPDVVLMDIRMPVLDGIAATRQILAAERGGGEEPPKVLVLTTFDLDEHVYAALRAGAAGFLLKETPPARIIAAVEAVAAGDVLLTPRITHRLVDAFRPQRISGSAAVDALTAREREVLVLVGKGLSNAQIAERFVLSEATVKTHVKRVMGKLELASRAQAVVLAYESGLVVPGSGGDAGQVS